MILFDLLQEFALFILLRFHPHLGFFVFNIRLVNPILCVLSYRCLFDQHFLMLANHSHLTLVLVEHLRKDLFIALKLVFHLHQS